MKRDSKLRVTGYGLLVTNFTSVANKMLKSHIQKLLDAYGIKPNKVLGQNFLIDERAVGDLLDSAKLNKNDVVIEVGAGTGTITRELAKRVKKVIAVEKDKQLVRLLQDELKDLNNAEIINEDVLKFNPKNYSPLTTNYSLVGAIPYYLTARLFRKFLEEAKNKPKLLAVIIQKEVAQKIIATAPKSNLLAISVQLYGKPKIIRTVPRSAFWPQPNVDSAILRFSPHPVQRTRTTNAGHANKGSSRSEELNEKQFFSVVRAGFSSPRKQLVVNLVNKLGLSRPQVETFLKNADIDPSRRAQTLTIEEWKRLTSALSQNTIGTTTRNPS